MLLSNKILELSVSVYLKYMEFTPGFLKFAELLTIVFEPDVQYFKQNNPLDYKPYVQVFLLSPGCTMRRRRTIVSSRI